MIEVSSPPEYARTTFFTSVRGMKSRSGLRLPRRTIGRTVGLASGPAEEQGDVRHARLFLRVCFDLFVSGRDADRRCRAQRWRRGALAAVSAWSHLQGAGPRYVAVQHLHDQ